MLTSCSHSTGQAATRWPNMVVEQFCKDWVQANLLSSCGCNICCLHMQLQDTLNTRADPCPASVSQAAAICLHDAAVLFVLVVGLLS